MIKKIRKGFTVVELVIVIAVIAILAAIIIPFLYNGNSTVSADTDTQLIRNLNATLAFDSAQMGDKKHTNMSQVLAVAEKSGYVIEDINNTEETYEIIWDSANDVFCYLIGDELAKDRNNVKYLQNTLYTVEPVNVKDYEYWRIYDGEVPNLKNQTFSIYLTQTAEFTTDSNGFFVARVGVDAGKRTDIYGIKYENTEGSRDVVIKTNAGCLLTVYGNVLDDGTGDTISHYGESGKQTISCSYSSFLEFGASTQTVIRRGHYIQEPESIVSYIIAQADVDDAVIELKSDSITGTLVNTNTENKVTVTNELNHFFVNLELRESGGELAIDLKNSPRYSNTVDKDTINGNNNSIHIYGVGTMGTLHSICPSSLRYCYVEASDTYVHNWKYLDVYSLRICIRCGGYEYSMDIIEDTSTTHKTIAVNFGEYVDQGSDNIAAGIRSFDQITTKEHVHTFSQWETVIVVSCISDGLRVRHCTTCDATESEVIDALGHDYRHGECTRCGKEEGVDHYHSYVVDNNETEPANCISDGVSVEKCACGATKRTIIKALGHNYVDGICTRCGDKQNKTHDHIYVYDKDSVDATCISDGLLIEKCSCGETTRTIVKALGHNFVNGICTRCGLLKENDHTHQYVIDTEESENPTCIKEGLKVERCACGAVKRTVIQPLGHTYVDGTCIRCGEKDSHHEHNYNIELKDQSFDPDCTTDGLKVTMCSCGDINREVIPALNHDYNEFDVCRRCGHVKDDHEHSWVKDEEESIEVGCLSDGLLVEKCTCGAIRRTVLEHLGHNFVNNECTRCHEKEQKDHVHENILDEAQSFPPTCVADGLNVYVCSCGQIIREVVGALGHDDENNNGVCRRCGRVNESEHSHVFVEDPNLGRTSTCIVTGLKIEVCACGKIKKTILPFGPHNYNENDVCRVCGHVKDDHEHYYDNIYTQRVEATCLKAGLVIKKCRCGHTSFEVLPALGHNFVDGICTRCGAKDDSHKIHEWELDTDSFIYPTCLTDGVKVEKCHCGAVQRTIIPALGHEYDPETDKCIRCGELNPDHKHDYVYNKELSIPATCLEDGLYIAICRCGDMQIIVLNALGHNFVEGVCTRCGEIQEPYHSHSFKEDASLSIPATCLQPGVKVEKCSCGETRRTIIKALGHLYNPETDKCIRCGSLNPKHTHNYIKDTDLSIDPWCLTDGIEVKVCKCGEKQIQVVNALGHSFNEKGKCIRCGRSHDHSYVEKEEEFIAPTCQKPGVITEICSCGDIKKTIVPVVDHSYDPKTDRCIWCGKLNPDHTHNYIKNNDKSFNATCLKDGFMVEECRCGDVKTTVIDALGHNFVEGVCTRCGEKEIIHSHNFVEDKDQYIAPTCLNQGLIVIVCDCGKVEKTIIKALGHEYDPENDKCIRCGKLNPNHVHNYVKDNDLSIAPWCLTDGLEVSICRCGAKQLNIVKALGHNYVNDICTRCGDDISTPKEPHNHNYIKDEKASYEPTCEKEGLLITKCTCGSIQYEVIEKLGHDYDEIDHCKRCGILNPNHAHKYVKDDKLSENPTCLVDGLEVSICRCGDIKREVIPALGHNFVNHICTRCGEEENVPHVHTYVVDENQYVAPTCLKDGVKVEVCSDSKCDSIKITILKALGHEYDPETDKCIRCGKLNPNHEHIYNKDNERSFDATINHYGLLVEVCRCGDIKTTVIPALEQESHIHQHNEITSEYVAPTCVKDGYKVFRCDCGDEYNVTINKLNHDYDETDHCKRCGELNPDHKHLYNKDNTKSFVETCTNDGLLVELCKCGDVTRTVINKKGHNFVEDKTKSVAPTCTQKGIKVERCCNGTCETVRVTSIDALNHLYDPETDKCVRCGELDPNHKHNYVTDNERSFQPKCLTEGLLVKECKCGDVQTTILDPLGHNFVDHVCTRCGEKENMPHEHVYTTDTLRSYAATCLKAGLLVQVCPCGDVKTKVIDALGHSYDPITDRCIRCGELNPSHQHNYIKDEKLSIKATCLADGIIVKVCRCGDRITEIENALGHNFVNKKCTRCGEDETTHEHSFIEDKSAYIAPTCQTTGLIVSKCTCGEVKNTIVPVVDHSYDPESDLCIWCGKLNPNHSHNYIKNNQLSVDPWCLTDGVKVEECRCGDRLITIIDQLGHNYVNHVCTRCGEEEPSTPHEHSYVEVKEEGIAPTCVLPGLKVERCACGSTKRTIINALDHSYDPETDLCVRCGKLNPNHSHNYVKDEKASYDAWCLTDGLLVETCKCGAIKRTSIDALGHNFVNHVCTRCGEVENVPHVHNFIEDQTKYVEPTCLLGGLRILNCTCGEMQIVVLPAYGHSYDPKTDLCIRCGKLNPTHQHNYVLDSTRTVAPKCLTFGLKVEVCRCGDEIITPINPLGHEYVEGTCIRCGEKEPTTPHNHEYVLVPSLCVPATCLKGGYNVEECSCGLQKVTPTNPLGHKYDETDHCVRCGELNPEHKHNHVKDEKESFEETCTTPGLTVEKCYCGDVLRTVVKSTGHTFIEDTTMSVKPTCTQKGLKVEKCHCGAIKTTPIDALNHLYDPETDKCVRCGELDPKHQHNYVKDEKASYDAKCLLPGLLVEVCKCGDVRRTPINALGHNYVDHVCTRCGDNEELDHKHSYVKNEELSYDPTCLKAGLLVEICSCGDIQTTPIQALGHSYDPITDICNRCGELNPSHQHNHIKDEKLSIKATCLADGIIVKVCRCGDRITEIENALGHNFVNKKCTRCGEDETTHEHSFIEDKSAYIAPTCQTTGLIVSKCTCGEVKNTIVPVVDHSYDPESDLCIWCGKLNPNHSHNYVKNNQLSVDPWCLTDGVKVEECRCGDRLITIIDQLGHNFVQGICTRCGEEEPSTTHEHSYVEVKEEGIAPTCVLPGLKVERCACGSTKRTIINALDHSYDPETDLCIRCGKLNPNHSHNYVKDEKASYDPWCLTDGLLVETCKCGAIKRTSINALNHNFVNHVCTRCGEVENVPHVHKFEEDKSRYVAPWCLTEGLRVMVCACGEMEIVVLPAYGHSYDPETDLCIRCGKSNPNHSHNYVIDSTKSYAPKCLTFGLTVEVCRCGDEKITIVPALGHNFVEGKCIRCGEKEPTTPHNHEYVLIPSLCVPATCLKGGYNVEECSCGLQKVTPTNPLGHKYDETDHCVRCGKLNPEHKHNHVKDEKESFNETCTTPGLTVEKCYCGDVLRTVVKSTGHTFIEDTTMSVKPTCTQKGLKVEKCHCGAIKTTPIDALNHLYDPETDKCVRCGELDPKHQHNYVKDEKASYDAKCLLPGLLVEVCKCGDIKYTTINPLNHNFNEKGICTRCGAEHEHNYIKNNSKSYDPWCLTAGLLYEECACGKVRTTPIKSLGHDFNKETDICNRCGELNPAHIHNYIVDTTKSIPAKCLEAGLEVAVCRCGDVRRTVINALGHDYGKDDRCQRIIDDLGHTCMSLKPNHEHDFVEDKEKTYQPTCLLPGLIVKVCKCGEVSREVVQALGHNYVDGICTRCGKEEGVNHIHDYKFNASLSTPATCIVDGLNVYVCQCTETKQSFKYEVVPADGINGHDYNPTTERCNYCGKLNPNHSCVGKLVEDKSLRNNPTCINTGNAYYTCSICGQSTTSELPIDKVNGHDYNANDICNRCGELNPSHKHDLKEQTIYQPECIKEGLKVTRCYCGYEVYEVLPVKGHSWDATNTFCKVCGVRNPNHKHDVKETSRIPATCGATGLVTKQCACGYTEYEILPSTGHKYDNNNLVCTVCGCINENHQHSFGNYVEETKATCLVPSIEKRTCACGAYEYRSSQPALGHEYDKTTHKCIRCGVQGDHQHSWTTTTDNGNCMQEGFITRKCSCGQIEYEVIGFGNHDYNKKTQRCNICGTFNTNHIHEYKNYTTVYEPTCLEKGLEKGTCTCGVVDYREMNSLGHSYNNKQVCTRCGILNENHVCNNYRLGNTQSATCVSPGYKEKICKVCGNTTYEILSIDKNAHQINSKGICNLCGYNSTNHTCNLVLKETKAATCLSDGYKKYACTCGKVNYEIITAPGHNYVDDWVCKECSQSILFLTSHVHTWTYKSTTQEATCVQQGVDKYVCTDSQCGAIKYVSTYPNHQSYWKLNKATGLKYLTNSVKCTKGTYYYECSKCDVNFLQETLNCTHSSTKTTAGSNAKKSVDATCDNYGYKYKTCSNCKIYVVKIESISDKAIENHSTDTSTLNKYYKKSGRYYCSVCKIMVSKKEYCTHSYVEYTDSSSPNCINPGYNSTICTKCGSVKYQLMSALGDSGHSFDKNGVCLICGKSKQLIESTHNHAFNTETKHVNASCISNGVIVNKCSCGQTQVTILNIDKTNGHNYVNDVCSLCGVKKNSHTCSYQLVSSQKATCINEGYEIYKCSCGKSYQKTLNIDTTSGHDYNNGTGKCKLCGIINPAHNHTFKTITNLSANCINQGLVEKQCTICNYIQRTLTPSTGVHQYDTNTNICKICGKLKDHDCSKFMKVYDQIPATCKAQGLIYQMCNVCGKIEVTILPIDTVNGHNFDKTTDKCTICGILATNHKHVMVEDKNAYVAPDCIHQGLTITKCSLCGYTTYNIVNALGDNGHDFDSKTLICKICGISKSHQCNFVLVADKCIGATCIKEGITYKACTLCGAVDIEIGEKNTETGHKWNNTTNRCEYCGKVKDHDCEANYTTTKNMPATCIADGIIIKKCNICGHIESTILPKDLVNGHKINAKDFCDLCGVLNPKHQHKYTTELVKEYQAPTCTSNGYKVYQCSCGAIENELVPALGHVFVDDVCQRCGQLHENHIHKHYYAITKEIAPKCTSDGIRVEQCICGLTTTTILYALGHNFVDGVCTRCQIADVPHEHNYVNDIKNIPATCTTPGIIVKQCACGATETTIIEAADHNWYRIEYTAPKCLVQGYAFYKCTACTATKEETIQALGHKYGDDPITTVPADCTTDGYKTYKCTRCEDTFSIVLTAKGHKLQYQTVDPTCTTPGKQTVSCMNCDFHSESTLPATGHIYSNWTSEDDTNHIRECKLCHDIQREEHNMKDGSCTTCGADNYVCEVLGFKFRTLQEGFDASLSFYHAKSMTDLITKGELSIFDYETVRMISDTTITETVTHPGGYGLALFGSVLDLNGYTITLSDDVQIINEGNLYITDTSKTKDGQIIGNVKDGAVIVQRINEDRTYYSILNKENFAKISIEGGTIINNTTYNSLYKSSVIENTADANYITVNGGTLISNNAQVVINAQSGSLILNGGTLKATHYAVYAKSATIASDSKVIIDAKYVKLVENTGFKLYGGYYVYDPSAYLEEGYAAKQDNSAYYTIYKAETESLTGIVIVKWRGWFFSVPRTRTFYSFDEAMAFVANEDFTDCELVLQRNASCGMINVSKNVTINLNGFTLTSTCNDALFQLTYGQKKGASLIVTNGIINCPRGKVAKFNGKKSDLDGEVTFDGCRVNGYTTEDDSNNKGNNGKAKGKNKGNNGINFINAAAYNGSFASIGDDFFLNCEGAYFSFDPQCYMRDYQEYQSYKNGKNQINVGAYSIKQHNEYVQGVLAYFVSLID